MIAIHWRLILLWALKVSAQRQKVYLDDLCESGLHFLSLQFTSENPLGAAAFLHLTKGDYPIGLECTLEIVPLFPHSSIVLQLNQVNLRGNDNTCFDVLTIESKSHTMQLCHQKPSTNQNESSVWSLTSETPIQIRFFSNASVGDANTEGLGFTINLITIYQTHDVNDCKSVAGFLCPEGNRCIPKALECDGEEDCSQGEDEGLLSCNSLIVKEDVNELKNRSSVLFSILLIIMLLAFLASCFYAVGFRLRKLMQIQRANQSGRGIFVVSSFRRNCRRDVHQSASCPDVVLQGGTVLPPPYDEPPPPYQTIAPSSPPIKQPDAREETTRPQV